MLTSNAAHFNAEPLLKPIQIGPIQIDTPLTLAPMDGMTNYAFRRLVRQHSGSDCGLVCTELLSSNILTSADPRARHKFDWQPHEYPFAVQIFGNDPPKMAQAAKILVDAGAAIIDINMGCWVPKVARKGGGAGLLRDICTATSVVEAVVKAVDVPVTVKVRAGYTEGEPTAIPFARAAEDAGVKLIAVHWRFASQGFRPDPPNWNVIAEVKNAVHSIPVLGNGDIRTATDAQRMMTETGCDGVMIGRAATGHPWLFRHIAHLLRTGETLPEPPIHIRAQAAFDHARVMVETSDYGEERSVMELRGRLHQYFDEFIDTDPLLADLRYQLVRVTRLDQIEALLHPLITMQFEEMAS
ncbi:MAG: tRNA-dihydrouridine synthase [Chloroflexota bacterium]|nr:tRNA dihydrouridine synthase DusB [Chloroflexota bacterium]NOG61890.1 tRNA dihydrouridine synthase DusB [Chloroflexota bacterium]GIK62521.1 MAG: tRNA-dihydrouridine synthase [Chloroflexota bacterium]